MTDTKAVGILLINTGSPDAPDTANTRAYLRQFLSDPRVIDIAPLARWFLVNCIILPTRPKHSAKVYRAVWTDRGSPLIVNSENFRDRLQEQLPDHAVRIAMAYGRPSVPDTLEALLHEGVQRIIVAPMFPQYASATFGAVMELTYKTAASKLTVPALSAIQPFYEAPEFLDAWAVVARPQLDAFNPDHILMSYHGLPERQIFKCDPSGQHCLKKENCCETYRDANPNCYRAHCFATTRGLVERLNLDVKDYTVAFQSRLGRDPWLSPAADQTIVDLARSGVKRLAIVSPAFVADCIETLEELGMVGKESFLKNGGEELCLVTSLNDHPEWVKGFASIIARY